jgi:hypothetical protein
VNALLPLQLMVAGNRQITSERAFGSLRQAAFVARGFR